MKYSRRVEKAQQQINALFGKETIKEDGIYGTQTRNAINLLAKRYGGAERFIDKLNSMRFKSLARVASAYLGHHHNHKNGNKYSKKRYYGSNGAQKVVQKHFNKYKNIATYSQNGRGKWITVKGQKTLLMDCSLFTYKFAKTLRANGIKTYKIGTTTYSQHKQGKKIFEGRSKFNNKIARIIKPGDLVFFDTPGKRNYKYDHVGIFKGFNKNGEAVFIHASSWKSGNRLKYKGKPVNHSIRETAFNDYKFPITAIRRIIKG